MKIDLHYLLGIIFPNITIHDEDENKESMQKALVILHLHPGEGKTLSRWWWFMG